MKVFDRIGNIEINEAFINTMLKTLINGASCKKDATKEQELIWTDSVSAYASNNQVLDANKLKKGIVVFEGNTLHGGIYETDNDCYVSDDRKFMYKLQGSELFIQSICTKQSFTIKNFNATDNILSLHFSKKPTKEVGIVVCVTQSMSDYIFALKEIAPFLAKHLLGDRESYAKVTLVSFASLDSYDLGTFYEPNGLIGGINGLELVESNTRMLFLSVIKAMRHFTKDNGLKKEIYLITNAKESDPQNASTMLPLTQNLNRNITANSKGCADNCVAIHTFSVANSLDFLRELANATKGNFYYANNSYEFKKSLLTQASGGNFDISEIKEEIRPAKNHKIYDPDNPNPPVY